MRRLCLGLLAVPITLFAADDEFRTVETAIKAQIKPGAAPAVVVPGHLGVQVRGDDKGLPVVEDVEPDSAADKAGLKAGDRLTKLDGKDLATPEALREILRSRGAGERLKITVSRSGKAAEVVAILAPASRPMTAGRPQPPNVLGVQVVATKDGDGVTIEQVVSGSVADKAKLKVGETLLKIDDTALTGPDRLREALGTKKPDDPVTLTLLLAEKRVEMKVKLEPERAAGDGPGRPGGWGRARYWSRPVYRIAIIGVEYKDVKHNAKIAPADWAVAMFSPGGKYVKTATGQTAYGSMHDYYWEQSYGQLKVEGKAFDYVEVSKNRDEYGTVEATRGALFKEAMDKLLERDGKDALKDFDGVFFIYAGARPRVARGSLYWPHKANFDYKGKSWPYFICAEGGREMGNISVFCHEFGHMLGLPDLYARPENPGSEGLGAWCAMAAESRGGRPQQFSAWCKEKLGWIKPVVIDPTVKQKLILGPVEDSAKECLKVLIQSDGSEYLLLENRIHKGFDKSLPAEGLLIWRVIGNRPVLEESHGVSGPGGPGQYMWAVPYPTSANDAFTPFTTPSSRSQLGGGLPVHITNIRKRPDGKVTFSIGYEFQ